MIAVGVMSGTSLDGIDAALISIHPRARGYRFELLGFATTPFDAMTLAMLRAVLPPNAGSTQLVAEVHRHLGDLFAAAARRIAGGPVDFVASHGQTIWHDGPRGLTLQIGNPFALRDALDASVCFDFRSADCTAGGHGAPLVPYVDELLLGDAREDRVALNLGGIANLTLLPAGGGVASACDTGPGNMAIDALVTQRTAGAERYDADGARARAGRVDEHLLAQMLAEPYFAQAPPKSTGRERFGESWLGLYADRLAQLSLQDACATLTEVTAATIAREIGRAGFDRARVLVSGGGVANDAMMERIAARLPLARVESSACAGVDPHAKEAIAFAVLGYETLRGRSAGLPVVTGATRPALLGAIAPVRLRRLLERIEAECASSS